MSDRWLPVGFEHPRRVELANGIAAHQSFNYAVLAEEESTLLGCVSIDPSPRSPGRHATVSWWVVDDALGTPPQAALDRFLPRWLARDWPFDSVTVGVERFDPTGSTLAEQGIRCPTADGRAWLPCLLMLYTFAVCRHSEPRCTSLRSSALASIGRPRPRA